MNTYVCPKVRAYIENEILPRYNALPGHTGDHIKNVIERSLRIASMLEGTDNEVDVNLVYVIAAYHDLGREIANKTHHEWSAYLLRRDEKLSKLFLPEEIEIMAEAVEDHRASSERPEPRSIYGKIVSSADRSYSVDEILARAYDYNKTLHPNYTEDELIEAVRRILRRKYSPDGYAATKIYFLKEEYYEFLKEVDRLTRDPEQFKKTQQEFNKKRGL